MSVPLPKGRIAAEFLTPVQVENHTSVVIVGSGACIFFFANFCCIYAELEKTFPRLMGRLQAATDAGATAMCAQVQFTEMWADVAQCNLGVNFVQSNDRTKRTLFNQMLLDCGGFDKATVKVQDMLSELADAIYRGHLGNDGRAIAWGLQMRCSPGRLRLAKRPRISVCAPRRFEVVGSHGGCRRAEQRPRSALSRRDPVLRRCSEKYACTAGWRVTKCLRRCAFVFAQNVSDFMAMQCAGWAKDAKDMAAQMQLVGCPSEALQATLDAWQPDNGFEAGCHFKRALQAPLYAVNIKVALSHTLGGLDINLQMRVMCLDDAPLTKRMVKVGAARSALGRTGRADWSVQALLRAIAGGCFATNGGMHSCKTLQQVSKDSAP